MDNTENCLNLIGKIIKEEREKNHLTQGDLAKKMQIDTSQICKYEKGTISGIYNLYNLAVTLKISFDNLLELAFVSKNEYSNFSPRDKYERIGRNFFKCLAYLFRLNEIQIINNNTGQVADKIYVEANNFTLDQYSDNYSIRIQNRTIIQFIIKLCMTFSDTKIRNSTKVTDEFIEGYARDLEQFLKTSFEERKNKNFNDIVETSDNA